MAKLKSLALTLQCAKSKRNYLVLQDIIISLLLALDPNTYGVNLISQCDQTYRDPNPIAFRLTSACLQRN